MLDVMLVMLFSVMLVMLLDVMLVMLSHIEFHIAGCHVNNY
jgi:hypothetical protein